jgi:hypothetical protein
MTRTGPDQEIINLQNQVKTLNENVQVLTTLVRYLITNTGLATGEIREKIDLILPTTDMVKKLHDDWFGED